MADITTSQRTTSVLVEYCNGCSTERWPMLLSQPKTYRLPRRIPKLRTLPHYRTLAQLAKMLRWPMLLGQPKTYMLPRRIPKLRTLPHPQARPIRKLRTILHPHAWLIPNLGLVSVWGISTGRKMRTNQRIFLGRSNRGPQWAFWVRHWVSNMLQRIPQV